MTEESSATQAPPPPPEGAPITAIAPPFAAGPSPRADAVAAVADAPVPTADAPDLAAASAVPARRRRNLRPLWWTTASLAAASLLGLSVYLVVVSREWQDRVDELTVISEDLGAEVVAERSAKEAAQAKEASVQEQLDTATARITDLANEEANATDTEAVLVNYLDAMVDCANTWKEHAKVLKGQFRYTETTTAQAEKELVAYCDSVATDFATLKTELGR